MRNAQTSPEVIHDQKVWCEEAAEALLEHVVDARLWRAP